MKLLNLLPYLATLNISTVITLIFFHRRNSIQLLLNIQWGISVKSGKLVEKSLLIRRLLKIIHGKNIRFSIPNLLINSNLSSYRNKSFDLGDKSFDWFLYNGNLMRLMVKYWIQGFPVEPNDLNPINVSDALIYKPVNWFAMQINWLVSIWGQHWCLMG